MRQVKLSFGEEAFMKSALKEAGTIATGSTISFDHTEGRAVSGLHMKGLVLRLDGEVEITEIGAAWQKQANSAGQAELKP